MSVVEMDTKCCLLTGSETVFSEKKKRECVFDRNWANTTATRNASLPVARRVHCVTLSSLRLT